MLRLYTDESPGLKVDPMVILFLSLGFIFSVVALHCEYRTWSGRAENTNLECSDRKGYQEILVRSCRALAIGTKVTASLGAQCVRHISDLLGGEGGR